MRSRLRRRDQIETWERRQSPEAARRRALAPGLTAPARTGHQSQQEGSRFRPDRRAMCPHMRGLFDAIFRANWRTPTSRDRRNQSRRNDPFPDKLRFYREGLYDRALQGNWSGRPGSAAASNYAAHRCDTLAAFAEAARSASASSAAESVM